MFSMCSELSPRARIPDTRIPQLMQPWICLRFQVKHYSRHRQNRTFKINLKNLSQGKNKKLFLISTLSLGSAGPLSIGGAI